MVELFSGLNIAMGDVQQIVDSGRLSNRNPDKFVAAFALVAYDDEINSNVGALWAAPSPLALGKVGLRDDEIFKLGEILMNIQALVVHPGSRRSGVGSRLVRRAMASFREYSYKWVYGQVSDETNLIAFYEKLGFDLAEPGEPLKLPYTNGLVQMSCSYGERWFSQYL